MAFATETAKEPPANDPPYRTRAATARLGVVAASPGIET